MKNYLIVLALFIFSISILNAQLEYDTHVLNPVKKSITVNMTDLGPDYKPMMQYLEGPSQEPKLLEQIKAISAKKYPKKYDQEIIKEKRLSDPPENINGFDGNTPDGSIPEDNHLAVSNDEQIISVVNSSIAIFDRTGVILRQRTLESFTSGLAVGQNKFDPRIMYDHTIDKFIFVCLAGNRSTTSSIIMGFSVTNDATGDWNMYEISGNPRGDNTWTDYPMIAISDTELFISGNLIIDDISWQQGFAESLIFQISKNDGFAGDPLDVMLWNNIKYEDGFIRNLYPMKYGGDELGANLYFMSNRNFAVTNDSIFIIELTGPQDDPSTELKIDVRVADFEYGAPPIANQPEGHLLETNDARVLDGYVLDDRIHFVGNTVNQSTGFADVYHGIVNDVTGSKTVTGELISNGNVEYGYPSLAWTGSDVTDDECIILLNHTAIDKNPGISAVYYNGVTGHSDPVEVKEGRSHIDQFVDRWGDYSGCQRKYNEPGIVFTSASFGGSRNSALTYINEIAKPNRPSSTQAIGRDFNIQSYPNPTDDISNFSFEVFNKKLITIELLDVEGKLVQLLYKDHPKKIGLVNFSFSLDPLPEGIYYLRTHIGNELLKVNKIVKSGKG